MSKTSAEHGVRRHGFVMRTKKKSKSSRRRASGEGFCPNNSNGRSTNGETTNTGRLGKQNTRTVTFMRHGRIEFSYGVRNGYFFVHNLLAAIRKFANKYSLLKKSIFYRMLKKLIKKVKEKLNSDDYGNLEYSQFMRFLLQEIDAPLSKRDNRIRIESIPKKADVIYCSSTKRSIETAKLIQENLGKLGYEPPRIAYDLQEELAEVKFTKDILTFKEFKMNGGLVGCRTSILRKWYYGQNLAETFQDSIKRAEKLWQFLKSNGETNIILVTHGWYLLLLKMYFTGERNNFTNLRTKDIILKYGQSFRIHLSNDFQPHASFRQHLTDGRGACPASESHMADAKTLEPAQHS